MCFVNNKKNWCANFIDLLLHKGIRESSIGTHKAKEALVFPDFLIPDSFLKATFPIFLRRTAIPYNGFHVKSYNIFNPLLDKIGRASCRERAYTARYDSAV